RGGGGGGKGGLGGGWGGAWGAPADQRIGDGRANPRSPAGPSGVAPGEKHARGGIQVGIRGDEDVDEIAGGPIEPQNVLGPAAVDVEVAVGTKEKVGRVFEAARRVGDEGIQEPPGVADVAHDPANDMAAGVEV